MERNLATDASPRPHLAERGLSLLRRLEPYLFVVPTVLIMVGLLIYPLIYTLQTSVSEFDLMTFTPGEYVGTLHYQRVLQDSNFWVSMRVTAVYLLIALPVQIVLGVALAFLLSIQWRGVRIVRALFIIPMVVTPVVAGSIWKMLLDPLWGYINYLLIQFGIPPVEWLSDPNLALISVTIIDTWRWTPFVILIVLAGIMSLDHEPLEAAKVDGASWYQSFAYVTLPMLRPVILSAFVVRWLGAIKMFDIIYAATRGGPGSATRVINLHIYEDAFRSLNFDQASAMSILLVIGASAMTFFFVRLTARLEK